MKNKVEYGWDFLDLFRHRIKQLDPKDFDCVVGILRGGSIPATIASHELDLPIYWVVAKSYDKDNVKRKVIDINALFSKLPSKGVRSRVLLCDDVWDTGATITGVEALLSDDYNAKCQSFVLVTKDTAAPVDWVFDGKKQTWFVFPWEKQGK